MVNDLDLGDNVFSTHVGSSVVTLLTGFGVSKIHIVTSEPERSSAKVNGWVSLIHDTLIQVFFFFFLKENLEDLVPGHARLL